MFQSLIGTVQPEERVIEVPSDGWFQSLIGTVQLKVRFGSRYHVITRKFQSLIGTVQLNLFFEVKNNEKKRFNHS